jgi:hypothetical protein
MAVIAGKNGLEGAEGPNFRLRLARAQEKREKTRLST